LITTVKKPAILRSIIAAENSTTKETKSILIIIKSILFSFFFDAHSLHYTMTKQTRRRLDFQKEESSSGKTQKTPPATTDDAVPTTATATTTATPRKRSLDTKASALVTPTPTKRSRRQPEFKKEYVPTYIYKNIGYTRRGQLRMDSSTTKVFQLIEQHYELPNDLETNRKYGPKSGLCYEEHAIRAYSLGLLVAKQDDSIIQICTACASEGHDRDCCPTLV
jgi:hypothetical protein